MNGWWCRTEPDSLACGSKGKKRFDEDILVWCSVSVGKWGIKQEISEEKKMDLEGGERTRRVRFMNGGGGLRVWGVWMLMNGVSDLRVARRDKRLRNG